MHEFIYIYIYIDRYRYVCVCVCVFPMNNTDNKSINYIYIQNFISLWSCTSCYQTS